MLLYYSSYHDDTVSITQIIVLLILLVKIVISLILAGHCKEIAEQKGHYNDVVHAWAWTFWFNIIGCIYTAALPDLTLRSQNAEIIRLLRESNKQISNANNSGNSNTVNLNKKDGTAVAANNTTYYNEDLPEL